MLPQAAQRTSSAVWKSFNQGLSLKLRLLAASLISSQIARGLPAVRDHKLSARRTKILYQLFCLSFTLSSFDLYFSLISIAVSSPKTKNKPGIASLIFDPSIPLQ